QDEYELDLADEEALLELDDDEVATSSSRELASGDTVTDVQYVDEDGNLVCPQDGDTLVVVDEYSYANDRENDDEDVLDVAVDPDFESLVQETEDLEVSRAAFSLSTLGSVRTPRSSRPPPSPREQPKHLAPTEVPATPPRGDAAPPASPSASVERGSHRGSVAEEEEDDEEDDESVTEERRRGRFRAERRAGVGGGTAAKKRQGIPDSLDSVISAEDAAKVDAYMSREDERRRAGRHGRGRGAQGFRPHQNKRGNMGGAHRPGPPPQQQQHIEPWLQFGNNNPQGMGPRFSAPHLGFPGMASDRGGPRGKIFVNPQFRNGASHGGGPGMQNEGEGAGHPFGGGGPPVSMPGPPQQQQQQMPEPFLRPPLGQQQFGPPGGAMVGRGDPFATPMPPHVGHHHHQGPPGSSPQFSPAMERFLATGRPSGGLEPFDMPQGSRIQEFGGHHHPARDEDFRQPQQHQQHQHQPPPPLSFGSPPQYGNSPIQQQQQPPPPQHHQQHQHQQQHQQQPQQPQPAQLGADASVPSLEQQPQPQHPPFQPFPQGGPPSQPPPGHAPPQGGLPLFQQGPRPHLGGGPQQQPGVAAVGSFGGPRFQQQQGPPPPHPPPHQQQRQGPPFGKRPTPPPPGPVPQKALRLEAPHMPRKHGQGNPGRTVNNANIKEVPIVEHLPPPEPVKATLPKAIEEDSATKELRRKIEEQKKLREQVMRIKEERRKLAAMQRQKELMEQRLLSTEVPHSVPRQQTQTQKQQGTEQARPPLSGNPAAIPITAPAPAPQARLPLLGQQPQPKPAAIAAPKAQPGGVKQRLGLRPSPGQPEAGATEGPALKKVVIVRKNPAPQNRPQGAAQGTGNVAPFGSQQPGVQRGVPGGRGRGGAGGVPPPRFPMDATFPRKMIRIVSHNGRLQTPGAGQPRMTAPLLRAQAPGGYVVLSPSGATGPCPSAGRVLVSNLSVSTTEDGLRHLGRTCGVVSEIILDRTERQAVLKFKEHQQAVQFQKKYQRHMLDLSMIQVSLLPP
ncbi:unnamed protein product, partial [Ixodes hexagonus]